MAAVHSATVVPDLPPLPLVRRTLKPHLRLVRMDRRFKNPRQQEHECGGASPRPTAEVSGSAYNAGSGEAD